MKFIFYILFCLSLIACKQPEKSNEYLKKATEIYYSSNLEEKIKIDSSLTLTNKAIEFDKSNVNALLLLTAIQFRKKDIDELLKISDKLISLRPEHPIYLVQKASYLEINGKTEDSKRYYQEALDKYKNYLKNDSLNFDLYMEYVGALEASNDTILANSTLTKMKSMNFEDYQKEMIDLYKEQRISKNKLIKYWNDEIKYEELSEK